MPSYKSISVSGLKCRGNNMAIISSVNGWLSSGQEDCGQEACVKVIFMIGWNRSYSSWNRPDSNWGLVCRFH